MKGTGIAAGTETASQTMKEKGAENRNKSSDPISPSKIAVFINRNARRRRQRGLKKKKKWVAVAVGRENAEWVAHPG